MRRVLRPWQGRPDGHGPWRLLALAGLGLMLVVGSLGCGGRATANQGLAALVQTETSAAAASDATVATGRTVPARPSAGPTAESGPTAAQVAAGLGGAALPGAGRSGAAAYTTGEPATVEELLEEGMFRAGASPVHLAIRGTPAADSVRCAWRGIARTAQQREDAIRFWLRLGPTDAIPEPAYLAVLFGTVLDTLASDYRETAKANFLAIARGGESMDYLFLTCFADYTVSHFLLGNGTPPTTVTVAYDRRGEAASYDLYVREHAAGTYGSDPL